MTTTAVALVREIEGVAARAWPADVVEPLDGWLLRYCDGVTRRANSVWPNAPGRGLALAEKLVRVEEFYARRSLPARYQMSPAADPADLDAVLAGRGYTVDAPTWVRTADLAVVLGRTAGEGHAVGVGDRLDGPWLAAYEEAEKARASEMPVYRAILERLAGKAGYACLQSEGRPVAVGLGVHEGDWVGVFGMSTVPAFRRRHLATAVLHALAAWGRARGATRLYLQVMQNNAPALALYQRVGFTPFYEYYYREKKAWTSS